MNKTGRFTETAEIMARNMREQGFNSGEILSAVRQQLNQDPAYIMGVAEETRAYKAEVMELIKEAEAKALAEGNMLMAAAGDMAFNDDFQMWNAHGVQLQPDSTLTQLKQAFMDQTRASLQNITGTTGDMLTFGAGSMLDEYQRQMDLATIKMCSGGFSYGQAVKDCCRSLAQNGLCVKYPSGRKYNLDTAARMIVRTASSQLAGRVSESNMKKTGQALVYVSAHAGARPEHALWQGQVYLYDRTQAQKYPQYDDFYAATDYGSVTGLKGVNCSHNFYPYWEGDPIPEFTEPDPVTIDGKTYDYYEANQKQRSMERGIRQTKRELEANKAAGNDTTDLNKKLAKQVQDYRKFSNQAGLREKPERYGDYYQLKYNRAMNLYFNSDDIPKGSPVTPEGIWKELERNEIGREYSNYMNKNNIYAGIVTEKQTHSDRGSQFGRDIKIYLQNISSNEDGAMAIIHEVTHYRYNIGGTKKAELQCFIKEYEFKNNRELTYYEIKAILKVINRGYGGLKWK